MQNTEQCKENFIKDCDTLRENVADRQKQLRISSYQISALTGVTYSTVRDFVNGHTLMPTEETLKGMRLFLTMSEDEMHIRLLQLKTTDRLPDNIASIDDLCNLCGLNKKTLGAKLKISGDRMHYYAIDASAIPDKHISLFSDFWQNYKTANNITLNKQTVPENKITRTSIAELYIQDKWSNFAGNLLKQARKSRGIQKEDLSDITGVSVSDIQKYEAGEKPTRQAILNMLSYIFDNQINTHQAKDSMLDANKDLIDAILYIKSKESISNSKLANLLGCHETTILRILKGQRGASSSLRKSLLRLKERIDNKEPDIQEDQSCNEPTKPQQQASCPIPPDNLFACLALLNDEGIRRITEYARDLSQITSYQK